VPQLSSADARSVAAPLSLLLPQRLFGQGAAEHVTLRRVRPSDPARSSPASWDRLEQDVDGNLTKVQQLLAAVTRACPVGRVSIRSRNWLSQ